MGKYTAIDIYIAVMEDPTKVSVVDASSGVKLNYIRTDYPIINGPIVVGNRMTLIVQRPNGTKTGRIYNLPSGVLNKTFNI